MHAFAIAHAQWLRHAQMCRSCLPEDAATR
jgi:hypothetical protein